MINFSKKIIGDLGEDLAVQFLRKNKYKIIERNYRVKHSEIDIIAVRRQKDLGVVLCFVEVKTRKFDDGSAERATDYRKIDHMMIGAKTYCLEKSIDMDKTAMSFEHVSVFTQSKEKIKHFILPI